MWYTSGEITEAVGYDHLKKQLNNFISGVQPKRVHLQTCQLITLNFSYNSSMQFWKLNIYILTCGESVVALSTPYSYGSYARARAAQIAFITPRMPWTLKLFLSLFQNRILQFKKSKFSCF